MKALILNSGTGSRMGDLTASRPKCMTELLNGETILSRQLKQLEKYGVTDTVITTGPWIDCLEEHARDSCAKMKFTFVNNPLFKETNYIYSMKLADEFLDDDILLMHGDLVFEDAVLEKLLSQNGSRMAVSSTAQLPQKDFKAVVDGTMIKKVGIEFFDNAVAAQPLYKLLLKDWNIWRAEIDNFCKTGKTRVYAENAFNEISDKCSLMTFDVADMLCGEIDTMEDLQNMLEMIKTLYSKL